MAACGQKHFGFCLSLFICNLLIRNGCWSATYNEEQPNVRSFEKLAIFCHSELPSFEKNKGVFVAYAYND
ncbi:hypothetical protein A3Q35_17075 [Aeribacillus pallidus]|nr:hypothetical protein A3Q35_17075 [Aeribacillus pallidus]